MPVNTNLTIAELQVQLAKLQAENAKLTEQNNARLTLKVSKRGAVSLYGMGRYPVTLYPEQWSKVAQFMPAIAKFLADNAAIIKTAQESFAKLTPEQQEAFLKQTA